MSQSKNVSGVSDGTPCIKLDKANFMTDSGESVQIVAKASDLCEPIRWVSDNEAVATVDQTGAVTAHTHGDAIITASSGQARATCRVSVDYEGQNPILPPSWGLYICDPEPYVIDGRMYIFGSKDRPMAVEPDGSGDYCASEYNIIYTEDMIHWVDVGVTLTLNDIPKPYRGGCRLWGPSCLFKAQELGRDHAKYYFIANTNSYSSGMVLFEADEPIGPFTSPRPMTMDGQVIGNLDPGVLADDDGKVYFAYQHDGYRFSVCQLDPTDFSKLLSHTAVDVTDVFRNGNPLEWPDEGQSLKKRGNTYYYINMLNWKPHNQHRIPVKMAYLMAESPLGPWRYGGTIIDTFHYLDSSNIQGAFAELNGQWYVSYHMPTPDVSSSRYCWMDPITFNEDGTIRPILPSSSGPKGHFRAGEKIQASSGVQFSGGRGDKRIIQRYEGDLSRWWEDSFRFVDYPEVWYSEAGQYIGYRYMDFTPAIHRFTITARTSGDGALIRIYQGKDDLPCEDLPVASVALPNTHDRYQSFTVPAVVPQCGTHSFYVVADAMAESGNVYVDSMCFEV